MHGLKYAFSKLFWGGAQPAPPQTSPLLNLGLRPRFELRLNSRALRALDPGHRQQFTPSKMFINPSPTEGDIDQTLFPTPNSCLPNTGPKITFQEYVVGLIYTIEKIIDSSYWLGELLENPLIQRRHNKRVIPEHTTRNYCARCFHFSPKCPKIVGGWGSAPDPAVRAYSAPPGPLAALIWDGDLVTTLVGVISVPHYLWPVPRCFEASYRPGHRMFDCFEMHISKKHVIYYRLAITLNVATKSN